MKLNITRAAIIGLLAVLLAAIPLLIACSQPAPSPTPAQKPASAPTTAAPKPSPAVAPSPAAAPKVEKPKSIKLGFLVDFTGLQTWSAFGFQGAKSYVEKLNRDGGIDGVPVELLWADTRTDAALNMAAYKRFEMSGAMMIYAVGSPDLKAIEAATLENMMPVVGQSIGMEFYFPPKPNLYTFHASCGMWVISTLTPFVDMWKKEFNKPLKLGVLVLEHPAFVPNIPIYQAWAPENGVEIVGIERYPAAALEVKTELGRLKAAGADAIMIDSVSPVSWRAVRDMGELGMLPGLEFKDSKFTWRQGGITALGHMATTTETGWETAGKWAGYMFTHLDKETYPFVDQSKVPAFKEYWDEVRKVWDEKTALTHQAEFHYLWQATQVMEMAIRETVKKVGWNNLSRKAIVENGLPGLKIDTKGITGAFSYADYTGDRTGLGMQKFAVFDTQHGVRRGISDWREFDKYSYDKGYYPKIPNTKIK